MDKKENYGVACGEITAFLSMIFLLILALVGTTLESARVNAGRSYANRSLQNAMDSLFTEYCVPLWEDYHLFFLEGEANEEEDKGYIGAALQDYMGTSTDLLDMELIQLEISDIVRADDYNGELMFHEILEYEKYQIDEEFLGGEKSLMKAIEEVNSCMTVVEKQLEAEQKMAEVNIDALEFISAVEGISVGKNGIRKKWNGLLRTEKYFVKKFCASGISQSTVGISHKKVWESLKSKYKNPVSLVAGLQREAYGILAQLEFAQAQREAGEEVTVTIDYMSFYFLKKALLKEAEGVLKEIEEAQKILSEIEKKQSIFSKETAEFERVLLEESDKLSKENRRALEEELKKLKGFTGTEENENTSMIAGILKMKPYLENDKKLAELLCSIRSLSVGGSIEAVEACIEKLESIKESVKGYQTREMQFDYSSLIIDETVGNPMEAFSKGYKDNLLKLVVEDMSKISKKTKGSSSKESFVQKDSVQKDSVQEEDGGSWYSSGEEKVFLGDSLKKSETDGYTEEVQTGVEDFNVFYDGSGWVKEEVNEQLQKVLLSHYAGSHFENYVEKGKAEASKQEDTKQNIVEKENAESEAAGQKKETELDYEEEYILSGEKSDKENLEEIVKKIVLFRTVLNYTYLLTDREKSELAYGTAVALVGYSCMEPLVQLTKNLILLIWAMEEAIIDCGALLQGKELPLFKSRDTFQITFEELLVFNRELVHKKLKEIPSITGGVTMDYQQYIRIFLNFVSKEEKLNRIMSLIEGNMQLRYDKGFLLGNCIYGMEVEGSFHMPEKFLSLPFVKLLLDTDKEGFQINLSQSYCY